MAAAAAEKMKPKYDLKVTHYPSMDGCPGLIWFSPDGSYDQAELTYRETFLLIRDLLRLLKSVEPRRRAKAKGRKKYGTRGT
jgi:hypothetical protein